MCNAENGISDALERLDALASDIRKTISHLQEAENELYSIQRELYEKQEEKQ